jgi:serine phosphatase RsbU (regulator of sigma subunit)
VARAGHLPVYVRRRSSGQIIQIMPRGKPLGFLQNPQIGEEIFELAGGDRVVLCTDGLTEALADADDASGERRFIQLLSAADGMHRDALADELVRVSAGEIGGVTSLSDDITLIVADFQDGNSNASRSPDVAPTS